VDVFQFSTLRFFELCHYCERAPPLPRRFVATVRVKQVGYAGLGSVEVFSFEGRRKAAQEETHPRTTF
jgi:hypothetical protein